MARIAGVDLPRDKRIEIALTYIYGIGLTTSKKLLAEGGINPDTRTRDLTEDEVVKLRELIDRDVISVARLRLISSVSLKLAATVVVVIVSAFRSAGRTRRTTPVPVRDRERRLQERKRIKGGIGFGS